LLNGPGTCIPIAFVVFFFANILRILPRCKIVFVESICRVEKLSLTGKILYNTRICDHLIVQWPELKTLYPRSEYLGQLV
jgi:beta-1,4-N-acetylglucosaminyltransferase